MSRELLELLEQVETAITEQSALARGRGDLEAGKTLHALGNGLFMARNRLRSRWSRRVWYRPSTWLRRN